MSEIYPLKTVPQLALQNGMENSILLCEACHQKRSSTQTASGSSSSMPYKAPELRIDQPFTMTRVRYSELPAAAGSRIPRRRSLTTSTCPCGSHRCENGMRTVRCPSSMTNGVPCVQKNQMCLVGLVKHVSEHHVPKPSGKEEYCCSRCDFRTGYINEFMYHALSRKCALLTFGSIVLLFALNFLDGDKSNYLGGLADILHQALENTIAERLSKLQEAPSSPISEPDLCGKEDGELSSSDVPDHEEFQESHVETMAQIPSTTSSSFDVNSPEEGEDVSQPRTPTYVPPDDELNMEVGGPPRRVARECEPVLRQRQKKRLLSMPLPRPSRAEDSDRPYTPTPNAPPSPEHIPVAPRFVRKGWKELPCPVNERDDGKSPIPGTSEEDRDALKIARKCAKRIWPRSTAGLSDLSGLLSPLPPKTFHIPETEYGSHHKK